MHPGKTNHVSDGCAGQPSRAWSRGLATAVFLAIHVSSAQPVLAQKGRPEPRIGYVYPAGACRNTTVEVLAGGQWLRDVKGVRLSGEGVSAEVLKAYRPVRNLDADQRKLLQWHIACRRAELDGRPKPAAPKPPSNPDGTPVPRVELPDMPLLDMLPQLDAEGITHWVTVMQRKDRMQQNNQLGETVRVRLSVAANAPPGIRELRFQTPQGLTNPVRFEVGTLPETHEVEPNESPGRDAIDLPCTINGMIQAGDIDLVTFRARRGQNLVIQGQARALIPYLADAVPGWFQMVITLRDADGREIAYGDDYRFDPDPVLHCKIPEDGGYTLEIRDSIYRGREDFVYRVSIGELPFVTAAFPLGGRAETPTTARITGWNLPTTMIRFDTSPDGPHRRTTRLPGRIAPTNEVSYAVDALPEATDCEPNDQADTAQAVGFPCVVNGRISKPGDADVFRLDGLHGRVLVVEVDARSLRSPLDSVIHVADERGKVIAWNDDFMAKDGHLHLGDGLLTHHADSRLRLTTPPDGPVFVRIADSGNHGGTEYGYRLRMSAVVPGFELRVVPSALNAAAGGNTPLEVHALRSEGFDGPIRLALQGAPEGFTLSGAVIPPGETKARITLSVPAPCPAGTYTPRLIGQTGSGSDVVTRTAVAADDVMQAFLWRHLVPAAQWLVHVAPGKGKRPPVELAGEIPIRIPAGGAGAIRVMVPKWLVSRGLEPILKDPPPGFRVSAAHAVPGGLAFDLQAGRETAPCRTNLIIDLTAAAPPRGQPGKKAVQASGVRFPIATLPAIPVIVTPPTEP